MEGSFGPSSMDGTRRMYLLSVREVRFSLLLRACLEKTQEEKEGQARKEPSRPERIIILGFGRDWSGMRCCNPDAAATNVLTHKQRL